MPFKDTLKSGIRFLKKKEVVDVPIEHPLPVGNELAGKVALVTGGTGGIGKAIAASLNDAGARVVIAGRNREKLKEISGELGCDFAAVDYGDIDGLEGAIRRVSDREGGLDIFVSSAGVHTEDVGFWTMTPEEFERVMDTNLKGTFFACRAAGAVMRDSESKGHILLIGSSRGFEPAWSPYGISKWGMRGLTLGLAQTLGEYGISVTAIAPGSTATGLIGYKDGDNIASDENVFGRLIMPDEVATLSRYLVSDAGSMVTGQTILLSGGRGSFDVR